MIPSLRIIVSDLALKDTDERLFPVSRNRSQRIHKKLLTRFGGEFRKAPAMWRTGDTLVIHPAIEADLHRAAAVKLRDKAGMNTLRGRTF